MEGETVRKMEERAKESRKLPRFALLSPFFECSVKGSRQREQEDGCLPLPSPSAELRRLASLASLDLSHAAPGMMENCCRSMKLLTSRAGKKLPFIVRRRSREVKRRRRTQRHLHSNRLIIERL